MAGFDIKLVLDDVRARDTALLNLLLTNDRQAMDLFRIYVTIGAVTAATAVSGVLAPDTLLSQTRWAAVIVTVLLAVASALCHFAMQSVEVGIPGKDADFWQWGQGAEVTDDHFLSVYLQYSMEHQAINRRLGERATRLLRWAKNIGVAAPIIGLLAVAVPKLLNFGWPSLCLPA